MDPKVLANPFPWQRPFWNLIFLCNVPKAPVECVRLHSIVTFDRVCTWAFQLLKLTQSFQRIWDFNVSITCKTFQKANPGAWSLLDIIWAIVIPSWLGQGKIQAQPRQITIFLGGVAGSKNAPARSTGIKCFRCCLCLFVQVKGGSTVYVLFNQFFFWYEKTQKTMALTVYGNHRYLHCEHQTI